MNPSVQILSSRHILKKDSTTSTIPLWECQPVFHWDLIKVLHETKLSHHPPQGSQFSISRLRNRSETALNTLSMKTALWFEKKKSQDKSRNHFQINISYENRLKNKNYVLSLFLTIVDFRVNAMCNKRITIYILYKIKAMTQWTQQPMWPINMCSFQELLHSYLYYK